MDLADDNAEQAYASMWALFKTPNEAVSFIGDQRQLFEATDIAKILRWIDELDSTKFVERERASQELGLILDEAESHLKKARPSAPSAESQGRIDLLLQKRSLGVSGRELQRLRVIEVLERIVPAVPDATRLAAVAALKRLAAGAVDARPTQEAKASLARLERAKVDR
jgi:hypothetical protein